MPLDEYRAASGLAPVEPAPNVRIGRQQPDPASPKPPKRNKYNARRTQGRDGRWYDSDKEAKFADNLLVQLGAGLIVGYVPQVSFPVGVNEKGKFVRYRLDFIIVRHAPLPPRYVDVKGRDTPTSRAKRAALRQLGIDVEIV